MNVGVARRSGWLVGAFAGLLGSACSEVGTPGELILAIGTDLAMPEQVDNVYLHVEVHGQTLLDNKYPIGAHDQSIPATLTLAAGSDIQPVTIRVAGLRRSQWRTFREVVTTVPFDRSALLRMPVQWLCDESARQVTTMENGANVTRTLSSCQEEGFSCQNGACVPNLVKAETLPDYEPEQVFGGASDPSHGSCFDTLSCMAGGVVVEPDASCSLELPSSEQVNVALRVARDGICDDTDTTCFVPLDRHQQLGWYERDGRMQLPEAACERLRERRVSAIYVSTDCPTKTPATPPCGTWTHVGRLPGGQISGPGGPGAPSVPGEMIKPVLPRAEELSRLAEGAQLCCPLLSDGNTLVTCACASKTNATIIRVDPNASKRSIETIGTINPPEGRDLMRFPAALYGGALYWAASGKIQRTPLIGSSSSPATFEVAGAIYERSTLVVGTAGVFVLASGVTSTSPVQMLAVNEGRKAQVYETGGTQPVYLFGDDESFLYLVKDVDAEADGGAIRRNSGIVRMNKATGVAELVAPEQMLSTADPARGGYTGVQVDGTQAYAMFEGMAAPSGAMPVRVERIDLTQPGRGTPLYDTTIDPALSQLGLVGTLDGAVVLSRIDYTSPGSKTVRSSSVLIVQASGTVRVLADFDGTDFAGPGLAHDAERMYWLNSSGRLFAFPRAGLR